MARDRDVAAATRTLRLVVEYCGTRFAGWQVQPQARTVQGELERAFAAISGEQVRITGASRTDAGVHALGQVASFASAHPIGCPRLVRGLNALLPEDVAVRAADEVPADFHARFSALGKRYRYRLWNSAARSPLEADRSWHVPTPLDLAAMQAAAAHLVGEHDWTSFATRSEDDDRAGPRPRGATRRVHALSVAAAGPLVTIEVVGDGFLYKMVRTIVGTLVQVGKGSRRAAEMPAVLAARERRRAGPTAPPQGLHLVEVFYRQEELTGPSDGGSRSPASARERQRPGASSVPGQGATGPAREERTAREAAEPPGAEKERSGA